MSRAVVDRRIHGIKACGKCPACFLNELCGIFFLAFGRKTSFVEDNEVSVVDPCDHVGRICRFTETVGHILDEEVHRLVANRSCYVVETVEREIYDRERTANLVRIVALAHIRDIFSDEFISTLCDGIAAGQSRERVDG